MAASTPPWAEVPGSGAPVCAGAQLARADSAPAEEQLLHLINTERESAGLGQLQWDTRLAQAARAHSEELAARQELSHRFPGEAELAERVALAGTRFTSAAENIALAESVDEVHLALMASPGHRRNILSPDYNAIGISVARVKNQVYVTEDFAHVVPIYSALQFRERIVAAFNSARRSHRLFAVDSHPDPLLDTEACSEGAVPHIEWSGLSAPSRTVVFSSNQPDQLPLPMEEAAADLTLHRMNIGVCYRSEPGSRLGQFWIIAAFFRTR